MHVDTNLKKILFFSASNLKSAINSEGKKISVGANRIKCFKLIYFKRYSYDLYKAWIGKKKIIFHLYKFQGLRKEISSHFFCSLPPHCCYPPTST